MNWLSTVDWPTVFGIIAIVVAAAYVGRDRGRERAVQVWKGETDAVRARANRLHDDLEEALRENAELKKMPDMESILKMIAKQMETAEDRYQQGMERIAALFENHERRATERHEATLAAFKHLNEGLSTMSAGLLDLIERVNGKHK